MNLTKIEICALADLVTLTINDRQKRAEALGITIDTKFWEELLCKLNRDNKWKD